MISHRRYRGFNELQIEGSENILNLPERNVLFVSNHQTYFADVVAMFHVFNASLSGRQDTLKKYGLFMEAKAQYLLCCCKGNHAIWHTSRILAYAGSISIERTWREKGKDVKRQVKLGDISKIGTALDDGWGDYFSTRHHNSI